MLVPAYLSFASHNTFSQSDHKMAPLILWLNDNESARPADPKPTSVATMPLNYFGEGTTPQNCVGILPYWLLIQTFLESMHLR
jgi:hypothetical protein